MELIGITIISRYEMCFKLSKYRKLKNDEKTYTVVYNKSPKIILVVV